LFQILKCKLNRGGGAAKERKKMDKKPKGNLSRVVNPISSRTPASRRKYFHLIGKRGSLEKKENRGQTTKWPSFDRLLTPHFAADSCTAATKS